MPDELIVDFIKALEHRCSSHPDTPLYERVPKKVWTLLEKDYGDMSANEFTQFCVDRFLSLIVFSVHSEQFAREFIDTLRDCLKQLPPVPDKKGDVWEDTARPERSRFLSGVIVLIDVFATNASSKQFVEQAYAALVENTKKTYSLRKKAGRRKKDRELAQTAYKLRREGLSWGQVTKKVVGPRSTRKDEDRIRQSVGRYEKWLTKLGLT